MPLHPSSVDECRTAADRESTETRECLGSPVPLAMERVRRAAPRQPLALYCDAHETGQSRTSLWSLPLVAFGIFSARAHSHRCRKAMISARIAAVSRWPVA